MAKLNTIRITGAGIYGAPTETNPTGEMPIGFEFETASGLPTGWVGRAIIVGEEPQEGAQFITGAEGEDPAVAVARKEVIEKADAEFKRRDQVYEEVTRAIVARAEKAEADLQHANEQIEALNLKLKAFEAGEGAVDASTADEIKTAVGMLDGKNDDHWTAAGLPAVDAVADLTGKPVTRKAITEAAPDAKRPTA